MSSFCSHSPLLDLNPLLKSNDSDVPLESEIPVIRNLIAEDRDDVAPEIRVMLNPITEDQRRADGDEQLRHLCITLARVTQNRDETAGRIRHCLLTIGLRAPSGSETHHLPRVEAQLAHSVNASLEICFPQSLELSDPHLLDLIIQQCPRWGSLYLNNSVFLRDDGVLDWLHRTVAVGQLDRLERLTVFDNRNLTIPIILCAIGFPYLIYPGINYSDENTMVLVPRLRRLAVHQSHFLAHLTAPLLEELSIRLGPLDFILPFTWVKGRGVARHELALMCLSSYGSLYKHATTELGQAELKVMSWSKLVECIDEVAAKLRNQHYIEYYFAGVRARFGEMSSKVHKMADWKAPSSTLNGEMRDRKDSIVLERPRWNETDSVCRDIALRYDAQLLSLSLMLEEHYQEPTIRKLQLALAALSNA
ncbi:hypothetical protein C8R47DRAFT_1082172 [Mycena vitilis]|nr:hypothetical protein C8R47DRAFT_1082172 [Mycena vitilis]